MVTKAIATMKAYGYNALILHQNDLLDICTQVGDPPNFGVYDLRRKKVRNRIAALRRMIAELDTFGAKLYLQVKEPSHADYVRELDAYSSMFTADGRADPASPAFIDLCRAKTRAIVNDLPGLGGMIINISSPESRVSMPDHHATQGMGVSLDGWFDAMIEAFHAPLRHKGMNLFVRDFSYTKDMQNGVMAAVDRCNGAVGASIKVTAHDYFPKAAQNPSIGAVKAPMIVETDTSGEHMGWNVLPNCRVAEMAERLRSVRAAGARGVVTRVSWEAIPGRHAMDTLGDVNVYAYARLAREDVAPETLVADWLAVRFGVAQDSEVSRRTTALLLESWHVIADAAYWNDKVFPRHSRLPSSWQEGLHSMATTGMGSRNQAAPPPFDEQNPEKLFAIKDQAVATADRLAAEAAALAPQLPPELGYMLHDSFKLLPAYARQFQLATKGAYHAAAFAATGDPVSWAACMELRDALLKHTDSMEAELATYIDPPYPLLVLFDCDHARGYAASLIPGAHAGLVPELPAVPDASAPACTASPAA